MQILGLLSNAPANHTRKCHHRCLNLHLSKNIVQPSDICVQTLYSWQPAHKNIFLFNNLNIPYVKAEVTSKTAFPWQHLPSSHLTGGKYIQLPISMVTTHSSGALTTMCAYCQPVGSYWTACGHFYFLWKLRRIVFTTSTFLGIVSHNFQSLNFTSPISGTLMHTCICITLCRFVVSLPENINVLYKEC